MVLLGTTKNAVTLVTCVCFNTLVGPKAGGENSTLADLTFWPHPHWPRRKRRSKLGRTQKSYGSNSTVHTAHTKECVCVMQQASEWDLVPFFRVGRTVCMDGLCGAAKTWRSVMISYLVLELSRKTRPFTVLSHRAPIQVPGLHQLIAASTWTENVGAADSS